jgi:hypothetical protein
MAGVECYGGLLKQVQMITLLGAAFGSFLAVDIDVFFDNNGGRLG